MARLKALIPKMLLVALALDFGLAQAQSPMQLSGAGLGQAKFGMTGPAVEQALGRKVSFQKDEACGGYYHARVTGLPGVVLVFARNGVRFVAVHVDQPSVVTPSGFKVGDKERAVIERYKSDRTYSRHPNRHDPTTMEIQIGRAQSVRTPTGQRLQGNVAQIVSVRGVIKSMHVGDAAVVLDDEYCA
jgi:hypothetical protein